MQTISCTTCNKDTILANESYMEYIDPKTENTIFACTYCIIEAETLDDGNFMIHLSENSEDPHFETCEYKEKHNKVSRCCVKNNPQVFEMADIKDCPCCAKRDALE